MDKQLNDFSDPSDEFDRLGAFRGIGVGVTIFYWPIYQWQQGICTVKCIYHLPSYAERRLPEHPKTLPPY